MRKHWDTDELTAVDCELQIQQMFVRGMNHHNLEINKQGNYA
jgi:hypothetical protein